MRLPHEDIAVFPTLTFWYGLSFEELMRMPNWALHLYAKALPGLIAEYQSMLVLGGAYPWMRKEDQRGVQRRLRQAQAQRERAPARRRAMPKEAYRARLEAMGFAWGEAPRRGDD